MEIILNKEQKVYLLKALKDGRLDSGVIEDWSAKVKDTRTDKDIRNELLRLYLSMGGDPDMCLCRIKHGVCCLYNGAFDYLPNDLKQRMPKLTAEEFGQMIYDGDVNFEDVKKAYYQYQNTVRCSAVDERDKRFWLDEALEVEREMKSKK